MPAGGLSAASPAGQLSERWGVDVVVEDRADEAVGRRGEQHVADRALEDAAGHGAREVGGGAGCCAGVARSDVEPSVVLHAVGADALDDRGAALDVEPERP